MRNGIHRFVAAGLLGVFLTASMAMGQGGYPRGYKHASEMAGSDGGALDGLGDRPSGWYAKGFGMAVWQQDSEIRDNTGFLPWVDAGDTEFSFDVGFGGGVSVGYSFAEFPISLELEYAYRNIEADEGSTTTTGGDRLSGPVEGDFSAHSIMFNAIFDMPIGDSRFGLYGGGGVGLAISEADLDSVDNVAVAVSSDEDETFAWQVMAGVTYDINDRAQLYTGVRYFDAGDVDFELLGGENQSINWEFGVRIYF